MKNLQEKIKEIKSAFDYDVKVELEKEIYPSYYYWINVIIKKQELNTYELKKLSEITGDYWITISADRKDTIRLKIMIDKESI